MKSKLLFSRHNLLLVILTCYLLPVVTIVAYDALGETKADSWNTLSSGLFLTCCGSLALFWMMTRWESALKDTLEPTQTQPSTAFSEPSAPLSAASALNNEEYALTKLSLEEAQRAQIRLLDEIDLLTEQLKQFSGSKQEQELQADKARKELELAKQSARQQLEQQQTHIRALQETIAELKTAQESKHQQVAHLETKVGDLTYEIKTLLQLAEAHSGSLFSSTAPEPSYRTSTPPLRAERVQPEEHFSFNKESSFQNPLEASAQLKRCIDIAQKITGSQRFGSQLYSFLESPADNFTLDLRRLCERLRNENNATILLYSPKENHVLFASNQVKDLTGWGPEKFTQNFNEILADEMPWKEGVDSLSFRSEVQINLSLKTRSGQNISFQAQLGMIPSGIFRNHIIAILHAESPAGALQA